MNLGGGSSSSFCASAGLFASYMLPDYSLEPAKSIEITRFIQYNQRVIVPDSNLTSALQPKSTSSAPSW